MTFEADGAMLQERGTPVKRLIACLLLLTLAAGCSAKPEPSPTAPPETSSPADGPAPTVTPKPAAEPKPSASPAPVSDGAENLGYFTVNPTDGVLEVPVMGLRLPLSGALLDYEDLLTAEVWVERNQAVLYLAMKNEHPDTDVYAYPYDYIFLAVWGETEEEGDEPGLIYLGKNDAFYYYAQAYADFVDVYPDYFAEQADCMTEEELVLYDALMAGTAGTLEKAEILPLVLPEVPQPEELGEWFLSAEVPNLNGINVSLGELIQGNKLTLINIWGTFCGPCIREMPDLGDLAREYAGEGFGIIGLTCDILDATARIQPEVVQDAWDILETTGVEYPVLILTPELERATDLMYVPTSYFLDASGRVLEGPITGSMSGEDWKAAIERLLAAVG
jgi:thiol-disulfide isomerase/thioredoxin